jgi:DNA-binding protein H-NS
MGEHEDLPFREEADPPERAEGERGDQDKRRLFERVMPEILKRVVERAVESGASRLAEGPENLRNFVQEMKLPKEVLHYLYTQIDDTKNGLYRVVAKEIRDVLEQTQFADELTKVLTKLSFEIKTEIRFVPNDAAGRDGGKRAEGDEDATDADDPGAQAGGRGTGKLPRPEVTAQVSVKDRGKDVRRSPTTGSTPQNPGRRGREDT